MVDPALPEPLSNWATDIAAGYLTLHASAVAVDGRGILILGASGSGKSSLALRLIALGAVLICDDMIRATAQGVTIQAERPDQAPDLIEARGIGLLRAGPVLGAAPVHVAVDLSRTEPERLPPRRFVAMGDARAELILGAGQPTLAEGLVQLLHHGRGSI